MCGIVGVLSFNNTNFRITGEYLSCLRDTMIHRGPDSKGNWISSDGKVGLGHRRLSILDLTYLADQPMSNEDETIWVVFNGEIYNFLEIRKELEKTRNHRFKTDHSDTEVIIHAFEEWGIEFVHKLRGMFAIALYDSRKQALWLIRDRIGKKPLYYSITAQKIIFASEIKAILKSPQQKKEVDLEAFYHFLSFLTTPSPMTLFKDIKKLPPATWMRIDSSGQVKEQKYWDVWDNVTPLTKESEERIAEELLFKLKEAVKIRKISDVPVGVFLSGGIDSSVNAALFSEENQGKVKTFSIGYEGEYKSYKNELDYARLVAKSIHSDHHELLLNVNDLLNFIPTMIYLQDEPIADPVCFPLYYVSKLARENGVVVCQVGEGSDELFCGYNSWKTKILLARLNETACLGFFKKSLITFLSLINKDEDFYFEWLRRGYEQQPIFWGGAEAFPETLKKRIISKNLSQQFKNFSSFEIIQPIYKRFKENAWEKSHLNWMTYLDLNIRLPELLLMRVDKMTMGVSLEARAPFLDHKFVEFVLGIPSNIKFKNNEQKYILKKAVTGLIPDDIIHRQKQGFGVPIYEWFFEKLKKIMLDELDFFAKHENYLNMEKIRLIMDKDPQKIWFLYNFVLWWKKFIYE